MDEIDKVLAAHYGFTEDEGVETQNFASLPSINYDIKYRMSDELGNDE